MAIRAISVLLAIVAVVIPISSDAYALTLWTNYMEGKDLPFNECMRRSSSAMRDEGFEFKVDGVTTSGTRGQVAGRIVCGPRGVAFVAVAGPDDDEVSRLGKVLGQRFRDCPGRC